VDKREIIKRLYSENDKEVIELLDRLEPKTQKDIVPDLINLLELTKSYVIKDKIALIFHDLKDQSVLPVLVKEIFNPNNKGHRGRLIFACEVFDCSQYLDDFLKLSIDDNYEVVMTAALVIENMKGPFEKNEILKNIEYLEEFKETAKKEFIGEVEGVLEYLKQFV